MTYQIGIIGESIGNGHPFSWTAIFNGYFPDVMKLNCDFPVIPNYLAQQDWSTDHIPITKSHIFGHKTLIEQSYCRYLYVSKTVPQVV